MLKQKAKELPRTPGVYLMKDYQNQVIYVGKAKRLKDRVSSYFQKNNQHSKKVLRMVHNIYDFEVILVDTELDALLLECQLIQSYHPMYNRQMNQSLNYLYLTYDQQVFELTHDKKQKSYGPFKNYKQLPEVLTTIKETYQLPGIEKITQLIVDAQLPEIKNLTIEEKDSEIRGLLSGENQVILEYLKKRQAYCIQQMNFEYAQKLQLAIEQMSLFIYLITQQKEALCSKKLLLSLPINSEETKHYFIYSGKIVDEKITSSKVKPDFSDGTKKNSPLPTSIRKKQVDPLFILANYIKKVAAGKIEGSITWETEKRTDKN